MEKSIKPGRNGLPPKKDEYSIEEKAIIVAKAAEAGIHEVADAYGVAWQKITAWRKACANANVTAAPKNAKEEKASKTQLIIQSPSGMEITPEEIQEKITNEVGKADKAYVRADEGMAYWVRLNKGEEEHGAVSLW